jgi:hypothetical protein
MLINSIGEIHMRQSMNPLQTTLGTATRKYAEAAFHHRALRSSKCIRVFGCHLFAAQLRKPFDIHVHILQPSMTIPRLV